MTHRPTLVLVHAFPLSAAMWDDVRAALSDVAEVVTPDLPGFGGRPVLDGEPSLDALADDLLDHVATLGHDRVVLGGLSLGGYVAMAFLRRHPGRVSALVLADTKASADPPAARDNRERIARAVLEQRSPRLLIDEVLPGLLGQTTRLRRPAVVGRVRGFMAEADPVGVAWAQRAMAARPDSLDTLRDAHVPALVVVGEEDTLSPVADAEAMARALPDARLVVVPGVGHLSAVEDPRAFAAAVRDFLHS